MPFSIDADLRPYNTFSVAHRAAELFVLDTEDELPILLNRIVEKPLPTTILGGGSNVLFAKDYPGRVIVNRLKGFAVVYEDDTSILLQVGAGENWHQWVLHCLESGYYGLENLSLIPGCVGAAPVQNIGAYGVEFESVLHELEAVHLQSGERRVFSKQECKPGYRYSLFKEPDYEGWLIIAVTMRLQKKPIFVLNYRGLEALREQMNLTATDVSQAVIALRQSKLPDPTIIPNGGSFFKNPIVSAEKAGAICEQFLDCPCFPQSAGKKLSAAWLLDQASWKGYRRGDAGVYQNHALVLVNHGQATGAELWQLACDMRDSVDEKFGICLEPEIRVI